MLILIFFHLGRSDPVRASVDPTTSNTSKIEVIWELPSTQPKGIFFAAHGCQHSAGDFWLKNDDTCPGCLGLPEELRIVKTVLSRGFVFVAVSSVDRTSRCWSKEDDSRVRAALSYVNSKIPGSGNLTVLAFGASSGGSFVGRLPSALRGSLLPVSCLLSQISPLDEDVVQSLGWTTSGHEPFPPTVFAYMSKDGGTASAIAKQMSFLGQAGVQTAEMRVAPRKIDAEFFVDADVRPAGREPITDGTSKALVEILRLKGLLDDEGFLKADPRESAWRDAIRSLAPDSLQPDASPISEMMNVAFAQHEIMSTPIASMMDFCANPSSACSGNRSAVFGLSCGAKKARVESPQPTILRVNARGGFRSGVTFQVVSRAL